MCTHPVCACCCMALNPHCAYLQGVHIFMLTYVCMSAHPHALTHAVMHVRTPTPARKQENAAKTKHPSAILNVLVQSWACFACTPGCTSLCSGASSRFQSFSKTPQGKATSLHTSDALGEVPFFAGGHACGSSMRRAKSICSCKWAWGQAPLPCSRPERAAGCQVSGGRGWGERGWPGWQEGSTWPEPKDQLPCCCATEPPQIIERAWTQTNPAERKSRGGPRA